MPKFVQHKVAECNKEDSAEAKEAEERGKSIGSPRVSGSDQIEGREEGEKEGKGEEEEKVSTASNTVKSGLSLSLSLSLYRLNHFY